MSQTILVTGASSGIGQATARLLAERGSKVFGTARKPESAQSQGVTMVALDVRSDESVRACVEQVVANAGRLDVLVNNAGDSTTDAARPLPAYEASRKSMLAAFGHALKSGIPPQQVARRVLQIIEQPNPGLRYRVGAQATWLPRLRNVVPWNVYAAGVRKTFAV